MSDSKPTGTNPGGEKKEMSMEQRMLLAFGLMGVVLIGSQFILPAPPEPPQTKVVKKETPATPSKAPPKATLTKPVSGKSAGPAEAQPAQPVAAAAEETITVESDLYKIVFSNRGAVAKSWLLKKHKDSNGKLLELVNQRAVDKAGYPFAVVLADGGDASELNQALYSTTVSADKLTVSFEYADANWRSSKKFEFHKNSYLSRFTSSLHVGGQVKNHLLAWRGGFGDETVIGAAAAQHSVHFDIDQQKLITKGTGDAKNGTVKDAGNYSFGGIMDNYFAAVALPEPDQTAGFDVHTYSDSSPSAADKTKPELNTGVAIGGTSTNIFSLFIGPKDTDLLRSISPRLEQLIDWGWFSFIAKPLFLALNFLNDRYMHNFGWTIVVVTVLINFALLPLKISSLKSMRKMSVIQPQVAAINEKYKGLSMRDPKKSNQNEEVMELYKKHGVNPMGGCVPMILQIPFFIAFYKVLSTAIEMRGASWLWVSDLSRPETLPIRILPITMLCTQFLMQKMTPSTTADPSQQKVMMLMPLMLGFMFYGVSSGLVLYWLTGNVIGIAQQMFFNKAFPAPVPAPVVAVKKNPRK